MKRAFKKALPILTQVAPAIAAGIGGPIPAAAAAAISAISEAFGAPSDTPPAELAKLVANASPEQLLALHQIDVTYETKMAEMGVELERLDNEEMANARAREIATGDDTPKILAIITTAMVSLTLLGLMAFPIPADNKDVIYLLVGQIVSAWMMALSYYFGTTRRSGLKDDANRQLAGAVASAKQTLSAKQLK